MKNSLLDYAARLGKYLLFILLLFFLERTAFLVTYHSMAARSSWVEIFSVYYHALHLDFSTAGYLFVIPFILTTLQLAFAGKWWERVLKGYTILVIVIVVLSAFGNIFLYEEWSTKINYKIWYYLQKPDEVLRTATWFQLVFGLLGSALVSWGLFWLYLKWFGKPDVTRISRLRWLSAVFVVAGLPLIFIAMRGHLTGIPISQSSAYFSKNQLLNDAAVNTQWHLLKSTIRFAKSNSTNLYVSMKQEEAEKIVHEMFIPEKDTSVCVLKTTRPNVVLIILESWSADLIESLGGRAGITPNFRQLEKEGILFTQVYAAGRRSQEGISSIISGFPPIPVNTITDNFEKYHALGSLAKTMKSAQYQSSFHFGGDLTYGNLTAYLMGMQFDKLVDEKDFPSDLPKGKLSYYDEFTLARQLADLRGAKSPFFSVVFTASSHSPYDVPKTGGVLDWDLPQMPYLNSARYADYALGEYFEKAKKEGWWDNTLFILVADHSHDTYKQWGYHTAGYQHVPMLWLGGALKEEWRGTTVDKLCSYVDLPLTLLKQLGMETSDFSWSNDIFNPYTQQFAPFLNQLGLGWITPQGSFSYDASNGQLYECTIAEEETKQRELLRAKAYLQVLYQRYLDM